MKTSLLLEKIVHVPRRFTQSEWGGTESVILNICKEQKKQNFAPQIHTSAALDRPGAENWKDLDIFRYRYCYPFWGLNKDERHSLDLKGGNLVSFDLLWHLLRLKKVRLYHAHVIKRMGGTVLTAARMKKKPFVVTLHGNVFDVPKKEAANVVQAQQGHFEWGKPLGLLLRSRDVLTQADAVICVGYSEYEAAKKALGHSRVYHLPNGVDPQQFEGGNRQEARAQLSVQRDEMLLGCISRIDPQKDQETLIRAFAQFTKKNPKAKLIIAGPVTVPAYKEKLKELAQELSIDSQVKFLPALKPESVELKNMLSALDCFVLPSIHEPFGIVVLEAWSANLPVITSKAGGLSHLVSNNEDGLQFDSENVAELTQAMFQISENKNLREKLAKRGKFKVQEQYSWPKVCELLEEIYTKAEENYY